MTNFKEKNRGLFGGDRLRKGTIMKEKYVYLFNEGNADMNQLLGRKGANLAEMVSMDLPVPFGFIITTDACRRFYEEGKIIDPLIEKEIDRALMELEYKTGKSFQDEGTPLLVSVRSGSSVSMPGMMDTVLNLGLNDHTVIQLANQTNNPVFAYDSYRRFIQMFGHIVLGVDGSLFEDELEMLKENAGVTKDSDLQEEHLLLLISRYKQIIQEETGDSFPQNPKDQLMMAIGAVFSSWYNQRAIVYRRIHKIPDHLGTAVTVQQMVFGNLSKKSGTGIAFSRNPSTGEKILYGEFMSQAQGEDIVAGIRTPDPLSSLASKMPFIMDELQKNAEILERHYHDVQDIEFTVEEGKLYLLQTRAAKRTAEAGIKIAVELAQENIITREEALLRIEPSYILPLLKHTIDPSGCLDVIATGLGASSGAATGIIVFDPEEAERHHRTGQPVILVRSETTPEDIHGMVASDGILTTRGGVTSHAAVVARDLGKPCVVGCESIRIDHNQKQLKFSGVTLNEGDIITICGSTGRVIRGEIPLIAPVFSKEFLTLLHWADEYKTMSVFSSVNSPKDARISRSMGAEGVGLCRTEQMFMEPHRMPYVTKMILARNIWERKQALSNLIPMQKEDFLGIFRSMQGKKVNVRLLDPPLHEFLPSQESLALEIERARVAMNVKEMEDKEKLLKRVKILHESNPSFGHRGCRMGITYPEIYEIQARIIAYAAIELRKEGIHVYPQIIVPLLSHPNEMKVVRETVNKALEEVFDALEDRIDIPIGAFMELPRACITAKEIAKYADFFIFGTNDLTQSTFAFSRDDAEGKYLAYYLDHKIIADNPFVVLDQEGVGELMRIGIEKGRSIKPQLSIGVCGEHTSEPSSVQFMQESGMEFISCLPHLVPAGKIAAAKAAIRSRLL